MTRDVTGRGGPRGFTLVELLIVVAIIGLLLAIFMPTLGMFTRYLQRMRCQINLVNCQKIMFQYAANNNMWLPPFSGSNPMEAIDEYGSTLPHKVAEELKRYGANASVFTCPAYPGYEDSSDYKWDSWENTRWTTYSSSKVKKVYTGGYVFFDGFWSGLPPGYRRYYSKFRDGRNFAQTTDEAGNPPFGADMLRFDCGDTIYGEVWKGWYHMEDTSTDEPGGGGNTVFLSGAVCWYDWEELQAGVDDGTQPAWPDANVQGSWPWLYFCGLSPRTD